ncbi:MAG: AAA family ATPase [Solidesulfovibrio sp. DCME]|uniref:AAA family ATPase n=1 Tax=Solidesulfovibrio sp. DCME TaxID=3447380 RepID=UPI003D0DC429
MSELLFDDEDVDFINKEDCRENERLSKFSMLARVFSVIPLHMKHADAKRLKSPVEDSWQHYCFNKRKFDCEDFKGKNAGIACGVASRVIVLDIDDHDEFPVWLKDHGIDSYPPETFTVQSGGKSLHLYYQYPREKGVVYGCRSLKTASKTTIFDIKGWGGQVVAPGSIHPSGGIYSILKNLPIREAPQWILDLARRDNNKKIIKKVDGVHSAETNNQVLRKVKIFDLPIPAEQKLNILKQHLVGLRSEAEMSVICSLVRASINENNILAIFEDAAYPIGEKHREAGLHRHERLHSQIEKAKRLVAVESAPKELKLMSLGSIYDKNPKLEYLVEGLWTVNDTLILFGVGGTGKSLFALNLTIALTDPSVTSFLDRFPVKKKCKVLMLQSEVSMSGFNDRVKKIYGNKVLPIEVRENIKMVAYSDDIMTSGDFNNDKFFESIKKILTGNDQDVIVIDPLISFHNEDENANTQMRRVLDRIKILGQETKTSILIIHHSGKSNSGNNNAGGRGASSIGDWASSSIELRVKDKNSDTYELVHRKSRDFKEFGSIILRRTESLEFKLIDSNVVNIDKNDVIVLKALEELGSVPFNQKMLAEKICELATGKDGKSISRNTAIKWIKDATKRSVVKTEDAGNMQRIVPRL